MRPPVPTFRDARAFNQKYNQEFQDKTDLLFCVLYSRFADILSVQ